MNTYQTLKLTNDTEVKLTLTFGRLLKVKNMNKGLYEKANNVIMNGTKDLLEMTEFIYVAYLCANLNDSMDYEEFVDLIPFDFNVLAKKIESLIVSKKK